MTTYNGYPSYNAWNVSLWINNDEGLYSMAKDIIKASTDRQDAAESMLHFLQDAGVHETPDGVRYTKTNIRRAMVGM